MQILFPDAEEATYGHWTDRGSSVQEGGNGVWRRVEIHKNGNYFFGSACNGWQWEKEL